MKIAVQTLPPWYMAALRFLVAGSILWFVGRARGAPQPTVREWRGAAISGTILLVLGNGTFAWCLQYIPSGVGALFFALSPLWNALIGAAFYGERPAPLAIVGIVLGLGGMAYLVSPGAHENLPPLATALGIGSSIAWSIGSMIQRRYRSNDVAQMSGMQMLIACALLLVVAAVSGERLHVDQFTPDALGALAFLIVGGSLIGFSGFVWLARHTSTLLASTYSYVNPVVAIAISVWLLHEPLTWQTIAGAGIVIAGVALMLAAPSTAATSTARTSS
jgi:drug/metabolite transporter (DMT)-like permease